MEPDDRVVGLVFESGRVVTIRDILGANLTLGRVIASYEQMELDILEKRQNDESE